MRLLQLSTARLADEAAERVRRNHHEAIRELQERIRQQADLITALEARVTALESP